MNSLYLTEKQRQLLHFLQEYSTLHGYPPTQREIAEHLGLSSLGTVQGHIKALITKGVLKRDWNRTRSLRLSPAGSYRSPGASAWEGGVMLRLAGEVAAGMPIEAILEDETVTIPEQLLGRGENFALRIKGNSMIEDGICHGDVIIVRRAEEAQNGQTVVALVNGNEATIKRYHQNPDGTITLSPANPACDKILCQEGEVAIQGVVVGLLRRYDK